MKIDLVEKLYSNKPSEYFSLEREIIIKKICGKDLTILDVGCGSGELGEALKKKTNSVVYGVELNEKAYKSACLKLDHVFHANIETHNIAFEKNYFDFIVLGDVLEHLIDPKNVLTELHQFLKPDGYMLITVPNIKYWRVLLDLILRDNWEYQDWGILDYTHLRFFTKKSISKLFKSIGLGNITANRFIGKGSKSYFLNKLTLTFFEGFLASHILIMSKK